MHAYVQMMVHADTQAHAMAEIISAGAPAGEEEEREGGNTPNNMTDAEFLEDGYAPEGAAPAAQMEVDLEGVADGAGEGGAEDAMAEAVQVEGVASDDSREWTTRSSSEVEEPAPQLASAPPALALMSVMQVMPGMHGQPDEQTAQPEASGAPPQQQQPQPDHAPVPTPQAGPFMYVLPPPLEAQPYESEAQRQHSAAAALWQQQQQQQQQYRQCDLPGCQQWCPWNNATGVFYAHCSQDHQWRCAQARQQQLMQPYAGPQHPMPPPAVPPMPQPPPPPAGMPPPLVQQPPPSQLGGGMPQPMPLMQQPPPPQPATAQLPMQPVFDPARGWQGRPQRSSSLPVQPPQPTHSATTAREAEGTPVRTSIDPALLSQIPEGLSPSFLTELGLGELPDSLEVNVYQMVIFVASDSSYCHLTGSYAQGES